MTFFELVHNPDYYEAFFKLPNSTLILLSRFICSSILHLSLLDEAGQGIEMMKYPLNHEYKFNSPSYAFLYGFLQLFSTLIIEVASMGVICSA